MRETLAASAPVETRTPRRVLKFSLATLMLIVTACSVWLAVKSNAARRQREGIALVTELGGMFSYNIAPEQAGGIGSDLMRAGLGDDYVVHVDWVVVASDRVDDAALKRIVDKFPQLSRLNVSGVFTDAGLAEIGRLRGLKILGLRSEHISDGGLAGLSKARDINTLDICGPIGDAGTVYLAPLVNLRSLRCFADPESIESSNKLEQQTFLECDQAPLSDVLDNEAHIARIQLNLDLAALKAAGISPDSPITASQQKVSLGYALDQILDPLGLEVQVTPHGGLVTTKEKLAENRRQLTKLQAALPNLKEVVTDW